MSLEARAVTLAYGERAVLRAVDFTLREGEIVALAGPNGSGKSTFLRALARLLKPSGGVVELDGRALTSWPPAEFARQVSLLSQAHEPVEQLTVRELVALGRHPHQGFLSLPSAADHAAIEAALAQTDLAEMTGRRIAELSGGEQQRAWFALSLAQEPRILLLDEPTTYLDMRRQFEVLALITRLNQARGLSVVMALHDLGQAARYAQRVVMLREGRVLADGPPAEVLTAATVRDVFGVEVEVLRASTGVPVVALLGPTDR